MPQILTVTEWDEESQFATLSFSHNRRFLDFLKTGIRPDSYREYDAARGKWRVHVDRLPVTIGFARRYFAHVDYRVLPDWVQIKIASSRSKPVEDQWTGSVPPPVAARDRVGPYAALHLLPDAPWEVVRAAYRALVLIHHPDRGGDTAKLARINNAYAELEQVRSKKVDSQRDPG